MDILIDIARGALGLAVMIGIAYLLSANRKAINWELVGKGLLLQLGIAFLMLNVGPVHDFFKYIADAFVQLLKFTDEGVRFVFGDLWLKTPAISAETGINPETGEQISNIIEWNEDKKTMVPTSAMSIPYVFAFRVLPTVIFFSAFSAMLFYLGILQKIIYAFAWMMSKTMRLSGAESISAAANVFIGQTEAPLVIKPYLDNMTRSEIMCLMCGGMATIAGGVFALFVSFLGDEYAIHFLTASIVSAPAAIIIAKILYPQTNEEEINTNLEIPKEKLGVNLLDAISKGTTDGIKLAVNVGAMLLVFIALVAFVNHLLGFVGDFTGLSEIIASSTGGSYEGLSLEYILGMLFAPIAWVLGVPGEDIMSVGQLLGKKTVINEVVAYVDLGDMAEGMGEKSILIATYALCGFANFSSIGIQIGGIGSIAPKQRSTLAEFGLKSMIGGTLACFMTAAIAGMFFNLQNIYTTTDTDNTETVIVHRTHSNFGDDKPYMDEYGRVLINVSNDTTFLNSCKDSTFSFDGRTGKILQDRKVTCQSKQDTFSNEILIVNEKMSAMGSLFTKSVSSGELDVNVGNKSYRIKKITSTNYWDETGNNIVYRSHEYWNKELGLLFKMDENFENKSRRVIRLKDAMDETGNNIPIEGIIDSIYTDSNTWILKDEEGNPLF